MVHVAFSSGIPGEGGLVVTVDRFAPPSRFAGAAEFEALVIRFDQCARDRLPETGHQPKKYER